MIENKIKPLKEKIRRWYKDEKKDLPWRKTENLFKILVSEIFLQQTTTSSVRGFYDEFFEKYKSFRQIYEVREETLRNDIKSLGLANKRAKTLKRLSKKIIDTNNGNPPTNKAFLENIKGIGDYISNAYLCSGLNERTLFYDVNIERIIERVFKRKQSLSHHKFITSSLDKLVPQEGFKEFYYALLDFGSKICTRRDPKCNICPLSGHFNYYLNDLE